MGMFFIFKSDVFPFLLMVDLTGDSGFKQYSQ